jgi:leucyl-tRNA synthetase
LAPHITEELWNRLGGTGSIMVAPWPQADPAHLAEDEQTVVVQVNGKRRGEVRLPVGADQAAAVAAAHMTEGVKNHLEGKFLQRTVYVPGKILNLVVS